MTHYGRNIRLSVYGGSHDSEIGAVMTGVPAGIHVDMEKLYSFMKRRMPGQNEFTTQRKEPDIPLFLSGIDENSCTNGRDIHIVIKNTSQRSSDYDSLKHIPRPSHADYPAMVKYGLDCDLSGGGHFSGRLTAALCAAGGIFIGELERRGISIGAHIYSIGKIYDMKFDPLKVSFDDMSAVAAKSFPVIDDRCGNLMAEEIEKAKKEEDSIGGVIECAVTGIPAGTGEHMFEGLESRIASMVFSIPAVKGIEFGAGFEGTRSYGSENNDEYRTDGSKVFVTTNNSGGICGGMATGAPVLFKVAFKPTPSIGKEQKTVNMSTMENVTIRISGRHDPCIVPRAVPVVEAAAAIAVFDSILDNSDNLEK